MFGKIIGTGSYVPDNIWNNEYLSEIVDTNDQWIVERTGIKERHIAFYENTSDMAIQAAKRAVKSAGICPEDIDICIVSTCSPNELMPTASCRVTEAIGAVNAAAFDMNAACSGFVFAYNTAQSYIAAGVAKTVLIVGAEKLSSIVDWKDRGTCILFADGAGAVIVKADERSPFDCVMRSDGSGADALLCGVRKETFIKMDGRGVFTFAVKKVPEVINELLSKMNLSCDDIDYFVLHQANKRIIESVSKRLKADISKFPMNIQNYGNTSSASIPILIDEAKETFKMGDKIIMAGFGAGLSWGAAYMEW